MIRQVVVARTTFSTKPSNGARRSIKLGRSSSKTSQIVRSLNLRMPCPLGVGDALVFQPAIQFGQAADPRLGSEQLIAQVADLVLDLALLPTRGRATGHRLDQM